MVEFLSKPKGTHLLDIGEVFTGGGLHYNGKASPVCDCLTRILIGEPATFSADTNSCDVGYITTTPSKLLENENDCKHFSIDGKIQCFSLDPLPGQKVLRALTDLKMWDCHSAQISGEAYCFHDIVMWGSTGQLFFQYPPNACDDYGSGRQYKGYKAMYWSGDCDYMYVVEVKCGNFAGSLYYSSIRLARLGLDATRTKLRIQTLTKQSQSHDYDIGKIPGIISAIEAGTYKYQLNTGYYCTIASKVVCEFSAQDLKTDTAQLKEQLCSFRPELIFTGFDLEMSLFDKHTKWGMLATQCAQQLNTLSVNGMAYGADIISLKKQVKAISQLLIDLDNPKTWASVYLSFHYGVKLTVSDTKSIMSEIKKVNNHKGPQKLQSSSSFIDEGMSLRGTAHLAVYYDRCSGAFAKLYYKLLEFDTLFSDMENLWDLVPFSFVVDWFVAVGDLLDQLDATNHSVAFNIPAAEYSIKMERQLDPTLLGLGLAQASLHARWYHRRFILESPTPSYSLDIPINQGFGHWIESGALILQKYFN